MLTELLHTWPYYGKTELQDDVKADYSQGVQMSLSDLMNTDPTTQRTGNVLAEGRSADGIVQIPTSFTKQKLTDKITQNITLVKITATLKSCQCSFR